MALNPFKLLMFMLILLLFSDREVKSTVKEALLAKK